MPLELTVLPWLSRLWIFRWTSRHRFALAPEEAHWTGYMLHDGVEADPKSLGTTFVCTGIADVFTLRATGYVLSVSLSHHPLQLSDANI